MRVDCTWVLPGVCARPLVDVQVGKQWGAGGSAPVEKHQLCRYEHRWSSRPCAKWFTYIIYSVIFEYQEQQALRL